MTEKALESLCRLYAKHLDNSRITEEDIRTAQQELFNKYCNKGYQQNCDPFYCSYRIMNTCDFIKKLDDLNKQLDRFGIEMKILV
jgi:uncharacterized protein YggE